MRPWPSRSVSGGSCGSVGQYGRPGVLNSNPGQSPDRPGLTERVRLKLRTSGGNSSPRNTPRSSMFRFDDADATFQRLKLTGPFSGGIEAPRTPWASDGRRNRSAALSQADGRKAFVPAARPHDDRVAVFEETARLAGGEFDRPSPAGRDLEQAAEPAVPGRRDRASAEQIARRQIAAAAAVMRHELGHGPVEVARVADGQSLRGKSFRLETRREQEHLELDVEGAGGLVRRIAEIGQRGRIPRRPRRLRCPERRQRAGVTTHGEMVVKKLLPRNGPSGWYSHAWMSRADQSFSRQNPAMWLAASAMAIGVPSSLPGPIQTPSSSS